MRHGTDQLPQQPAGLLLLQSRAAAVSGHGVDVLQQVAAGHQLQHQVGVPAVREGLIQLHLPGPTPLPSPPTRAPPGAQGWGLGMGPARA